MKKPPDLLLRLGAYYPFEKVEVFQKQTGTDTADTYCRLYSRHSDKEPCFYGKLDSILSVVDTSPCYSGVWYLTRAARRELEEWRAWEQESHKDLSEYNRLKEKLFGPSKD